MRHLLENALGREGRMIEERKLNDEAIQTKASVNSRNTLELKWSLLSFFLTRSERARPL